MDDKMLEITMRHSPRARHLRITIKADGSCVVTVPRRYPKFLVERFVAKKAEWIRNKQEMMRERVETPFMASHVSRPYQEAKQEALVFAIKRVEAMNTFYGHTYKNISVKNQKTRWGSCSSKGNLNFNYRILYLPPHLADYLVVHELCHLKEANHAHTFWHLVGKTFPNHRELRRELREYRF